MKKIFYTAFVLVEMFLLCLFIFPEKMLQLSKTLDKMVIKKKIVYNEIEDYVSELCIFQKPRLACLLDPNGYSIKSNCFVNGKILKEKIRKGLPKWAKEQIQSDLSKFPKISKQDLDQIFLKNANPKPYKFNAIARIEVKNKKVKITYASPKLAAEERYSAKHGGNSLVYVLEYLAKNNYISDVDFIIALSDFYSPVDSDVVPIFTFAKNIDMPVEKDLILMPDWQNLGSTPDLRKRIKASNEIITWNDKKDLLFWRGGIFDSTGFRKKFVSFSKKHSNVIDAEFVKTYGVKKISGFVTPEEHLRYKYLLSLDGRRASWERLVWHLHSNSLVFKQDSNEMQWFYRGIVPWVDYVPVTDEESILKSIDWAKSHPEKVKSIIYHASIFVDENLSLEDMYHYVLVLLQEYSKRLVN